MTVIVSEMKREVLKGSRLDRDFLCLQIMVVFVSQRPRLPTVGFLKCYPPFEAFLGHLRISKYLYLTFFEYELVVEGWAADKFMSSDPTEHCVDRNRSKCHRLGHLGIGYKFPSRLCFPFGTRVLVAPLVQGV